jgi:integrase
MKGNRTVWRYRTPGVQKETVLPGQPGDEQFERAYHAATRKASAAEILNMPGRALPRTFAKAARLLETRPWWIEHSKSTQDRDAKYIEWFLNLTVDPRAPITWRDIPVEAMTRAYLNDIVMAKYTLRPHSGRHYFNAYKKLFRVAEEEGWIAPENNPCLTIRLKKPRHVGKPAWSDEAMAKYEARHALGTPARTCFEMARWLGGRRGDVAVLGWDQRVTLELENCEGDLEFMDAFDFRQKKNAKRTGGKHVILPITDKFAAALAALECQPGKTILQRLDGHPYSDKSLTGQMAVWSAQAGLPAGHTLHGLRRNFARHLVKSKADIITIRDLMGHSSLTVTQVYLEGIKLEDNALEARNLMNEREAKRDQAKRRANLRIVG